MLISMRQTQLIRALRAGPRAFSFWSFL